MGSNRRYGSPSEQAAGRARAALDLTPHLPRIRHVWVRANQRRDFRFFAAQGYTCSDVKDYAVSDQTA